MIREEINNNEKECNKEKKDKILELENETFETSHEGGTCRNWKAVNNRSQVRGSCGNCNERRMR